MKLCYQYISTQRVLTLLLSCLLLFANQKQSARADTTAESASQLRLPSSSLLDFTNTLETPAGKNGFLQRSPNGHFMWQSGKRARFWGINVSSTRLNIPPKQIEEIVGNFARAGLNIVRLEAIDNRNCLLGKEDSLDSRHFDAHYLDTLDHWMDSLRRHGIYYYLDLLDFRTFKAGDGVLNSESFDRAARPYALFDPYLIQLQKEYATHLLTHRNPYSKLRPVEDPAMAMLEICNEHGFFLYPDKLETLVEPYSSDLNRRWNIWLRDKYGSRQKLETAWGMIADIHVLRPEENFDQNNIALPMFVNPPDVSARFVSIARRASLRQRDGVEFLANLQQSYFREMRDHLISIGVKIPITAVVTNDVPADVASVAKECDFTSENWYGEGIVGDPRTPGIKYYGNRNSLRTDGIGGFAPHTAILRWNNKPVVIREWATTWPNRNRAASVPEALAYASLQDYDAILLFGYQTNRAPNGSLADALNDFAFQSDPTVWGLYALAGQAFLTRAIQPATNTVTLVYSKSHLYDWQARNSDLRRVAWSAKLNSMMSDANWNGISAFPTGGNSDTKALMNILGQLQRKGTPVSPQAMTNGVWRSDTGQIARFSNDGRLEVRTPRLAMIAGELSPNQIYDLGEFHFTSPTRFGAIMAYAVDGLPLKESHHIVFKMVSQASNTNEIFEKASSGAPSPWQLRTAGLGPVTTKGRSSMIPMRLWVGASGSRPSLASRGRAQTPVTILSMEIENGTWELDMEDGHATLHCDTSGIKGVLQGTTFSTTGAVMELRAN